MFNLSTYLGHTLPENTYWYIEAVPELLQLACERAERSLTGRRNFFSVKAFQAEWKERLFGEL
jgi:hypothetical protein